MSNQQSDSVSIMEKENEEHENQQQENRDSSTCILRYRQSEKAIISAPPRRNMRPKSLNISIESATTPGENGHLLPSRNFNGSISSKDVEDIVLESERRKNADHQFNKHFPNIKDTMQKYYSCAYSGTILFQGTLFVTSSYFCFYSKMMPRKTICIKLTNIIDICKARTVKVVPNAVGVLTKNGKYYLFGSLISRTSTHKFMQFVWKMEKQRSESNGDSTAVKLFDKSISEDISDNSLEKEVGDDLNEIYGKQKEVTDSHDSDINDKLPAEENISIIGLIMANSTLKITAIAIVMLICLSAALTFKIVRIQNSMESYIVTSAKFSDRKLSDDDISRILQVHIQKLYSLIESSVHMMNESMKSLKNIQTDIMREL